MALTLESFTIPVRSGPTKEKLEQAGQPFDYHAFKEEQYDRLAQHVRQYVDMQKIYQILTDD